MKKCRFFHKWQDSGLFMTTCTKCGWRRMFTGFAYVYYPPQEK